MNRKHKTKNSDSMLKALNLMLSDMNESISCLNKSAMSDDIASVDRLLRQSESVVKSFDRTLCALADSGVSVKFDRFAGEYFDGSDGARRIRVTSVSRGYLSVAAATSDAAISTARDLVESGEVDLIEEDLIVEDGTEDVLG